jgi:hypothetical protein
MKTVADGALEAAGPHAGAVCMVCNARVKVWWVISGYVVCNTNLCKTEALEASKTQK